MKALHWFRVVEDADGVQLVPITEQEAADEIGGPSQWGDETLAEWRETVRQDDHFGARHIFCVPVADDVILPSWMKKREAAQ